MSEIIENIDEITIIVTDEGDNVTINVTSPADGREIELQNSSGIIYWRYVGDTTWILLIDLLGFTPENVSNLRTSFQVTPDDTHYISEKLSKDQLDLKENSGVATSTMLTHNSAYTHSDISLNTGKRHDAVTIGTGNGLSLLDQVLSLNQSSSGTAGALSSNDWNTFNSKQNALTFGIADTNKVQINASDVADNDYAKFTATGLEGRSYSEVLADISAMKTLTPVAIKTSAYTAEPFEFIPCNISSASFAVTLPTTPTNGTIIQVKVVIVGVNHALEVKTGGSDVFNVVGGETSLYLSIQNEANIFTYQSSTGIWYNIATASAYNFATNFTGIDAITPITNADISINTTTRVLTITPPLGYFNIYVDGNGVITKFRKTGAVNFPAFTNTSGMWYFYFDSTGTAVTTQTMWVTSDFPSQAPVYRVLWNATLYNFTITSGNVSEGDTYTNNGQTFTIRQTYTGATTIKTSGTGDPSASGTLTRATGTGDATLTFSAFSIAPRLVGQYVEYHLNDIPADTHQWMHLNGAVWANGFTMINNALTSGVPNADGRNTVIALTTGTNVDDNLEYTVTNDSTPTEPWQQDLGNTTAGTLNATNSALMTAYRQGATGLVTFRDTTRFPFDWNTITNRPNYITATGVRTPVTNQRFMVNFIYSVQNPISGEAIKTVSATVDFSSRANARAYTWTDIISTYSILNEGEVRPLYRLIHEVKHSTPTPYDAGCKYSALRETQDIRKASVTSTTSATGSLPASSVTLVPVGTVASTNVQSAIEELDTEKVPTTRTITATTPITINGTTSADLSANRTIAIPASTSSVDGYATSVQITKLNGIASGANNYSHPNHSGDATSVGGGAVTIANSAVTLAKMANMATSSLMYRRSSGSGVPEVNTLAQLKTDLALQNYSVAVMLYQATVDLAVANSVAFFTIPSHLNGLRLVACHARVITAGTTNASTFNIQKNGTNMLSTAISIDSAETGSDTAATAYVIDTAQDDVATNDLIEIDVLTISATAPKGLVIRLEFGV